MNGWKNYETWNVILWITKAEKLYRLASECRTFAEFRARLRVIDDSVMGCIPLARETPDGISWHDPRLDLQAIDEWWNDTCLSKSLAELWGLPG